MEIREINPELWRNVLVTHMSYHVTGVLRKSKDYIYGIWVYKALDIWKRYYRVKQITSFMHETVNWGKKL